MKIEEIKKAIKKIFRKKIVEKYFKNHEIEEQNFY